MTHLTLDTRNVLLHLRGVELEGELCQPPDPSGIVLIAHGTESSRLSPRSRFLVDELNENQLAALLFSLLTPVEEDIALETHHLRYKIPVLAERIVDAIDWIRKQSSLHDLPIGLSAAGTAVPAALVAASRRPEEVAAVVCRGGRPDLGEAVMAKVVAPTLMILGSYDASGITLNQQASRLMPTPSTLEIIGGASHLFEEPGTLEAAVRCARDWFCHHLGD